MKTEIVDKCRNFLMRYFPDHDLKENEDIFSLGYVNSLFAMQLVLFVEKEFSIQLENDELDIVNFSTLNNMTELISKKLGKN